MAIVIHSCDDSNGTITGSIRDRNQARHDTIYRPDACGNDTPVSSIRLLRDEDGRGYMVDV
jgi:hypothetical protein